ncbi:MAG: type III-B CRISPR module RAMP protein Cmr6 [Sulfuricellaceae bacterium]
MIPLVRDDLRPLISAANGAHPGLLIQRGWSDFVKTDADNAGAGGKTAHIERICNIPAPDIYLRAYQRWEVATKDDKRFCCFEMKIENRLLIGLSGGGALETGCAISHTYGMPYLPGSSVKGAARAWLQALPHADADLVREIFGCEADERDLSGLSGIVGFHDAWWVPESRCDKKPFVMDVVTSHHPNYYGSEGETAATDLDSPVPNAIIGVQGSFRFTLEGAPEWTRLAKNILEAALAERGIGAKTAAGYGYMARIKPSALQAKQSDFIAARLSWNPGSRALKAILDDGRKTAPLAGDAAQSLLENLPAEARAGKKIKEGKLRVEIRVAEQRNLLQIIALREKQA